MEYIILIATREYAVLDRHPGIVWAHIIIGIMTTFAQHISYDFGVQ